MPATCEIYSERLGAEVETFTLLLPGNSRRPFPSPQLRGAELGRRGRRALRAWEVQGLRPGRAVEVLMRLLEPGSLSPDVRLGDSLRYWQRAAQLALEALAGQQVIPGLKHREDGLYARWLPILDHERLERLAGAMPPVCRADPKGLLPPKALLENFLEETCDTLAREWSSAPEPLKDPTEPGSRWVRALFGQPEPVRLSEAQREDLERSHRLWLRNLRLAGDEHFRVAFRLSAPNRGNRWSVDFALQARDDPSLLVPAAAVWRGAEGDVRRLVNPREKLLTGLGYAARFFEPLERALRRSAPERLQVNTEDAFRLSARVRALVGRERLRCPGASLVAPPRSPPETAPSPLRGLRHDEPGRDEPRDPRELSVGHRPRGPAPQQRGVRSPRRAQVPARATAGRVGAPRPRTGRRRLGVLRRARPRGRGRLARSPAHGARRSQGGRGAGGRGGGLPGVARRVARPPRRRPEARNPAGPGGPRSGAATLPADRLLLARLPARGRARRLSRRRHGPRKDPPDPRLAHPR